METDIFFTFLRSVPGVFGNQQSHYLDLIKQMMQQSLTEVAGYEVSIVIVLLESKRTCTVISNILKSNYRRFVTFMTSYC